MEFLAVLRFSKELSKEIELIEKKCWEKFSFLHSTNSKKKRKEVQQQKKTCSGTFSFMKVKKFARY